MVIVQTTPKQSLRFCSRPGLGGATRVDYALVFAIPRLEDSLEAATRRGNDSSRSKNIAHGVLLRKKLNQLIALILTIHILIMDD
jgi:hypothetical protein